MRIYHGSCHCGTVRFEIESDEITKVTECNCSICRHCGIHPFHRPRSAPDAFQINVRCLDDYDVATTAPEIVRFDGQNWETSFAALKH